MHSLIFPFKNTFIPSTITGVLWKLKSRKENPVLPYNLAFGSFKRPIVFVQWNKLIPKSLEKQNQPIKMKETELMEFSICTPKSPKYLRVILGAEILELLVIYNWYVLSSYYNAAIEVRTSCYSQTQEISDCNRWISPLYCYFIKYSNHIFLNEKRGDFFHICHFSSALLSFSNCQGRTKTKKWIKNNLKTLAYNHHYYTCKTRFDDIS